MYDKFGELSQYNFELLRVKMSTSTIVSLLAVLGVLVGLGNPAGLGGGPRGIPPDFTLKKVQERIHFRGEGKKVKERSVGVVCVSYGLVDTITSPFYPFLQVTCMRRLGLPTCGSRYRCGSTLSNTAWRALPSGIWSSCAMRIEVWRELGQWWLWRTIVAACLRTTCRGS